MLLVGVFFLVEFAQIDETRSFNGKINTQPFFLIPNSQKPTKQQFN